MITLPVSEAYAFDYLAILLVKGIEKLPGAFAEFVNVRDNLSKQLNVEMFDVLGSNEYGALVQANRDVWDLVAKAAKDECKASEVDQANQRRYFAKKALQERFWPDKPLAETKSLRPT